MLYLLKRHPIPIKAFFRHSLVLTYAFPRQVLEPLLPPGLELDGLGDLGFAAAAMVQTRDLRPACLPAAFGLDFFLTGYRIFARFRTRSGTTLRGLRILRSDADRRLMVSMGNLLTHYAYRLARAEVEERGGGLEIRVRTPRAEADLHVIADLESAPAPLPEGSPFKDLEEARRFAGPLPFTFDYERETRSIVCIKGVREKWDPRPVAVRVIECAFFKGALFGGAAPILANAFHLRDIPYRWKRGVLEPLPEGC